MDKTYNELYETINKVQNEENWIPLKWLKNTFQHEFFLKFVNNNSNKNPNQNVSKSVILFKIIKFYKKTVNLI